MPSYSEMRNRVFQNHGSNQPSQPAQAQQPAEQAAPQPAPAPQPVSEAKPAETAPQQAPVQPQQAAPGKELAPRQPAVEPKPAKEIQPSGGFNVKIYGSGDNSITVPEDFSEYNTVEPEGGLPTENSDVDMEVTEHDEALLKSDERISGATAKPAPQVRRRPSNAKPARPVRQGLRAEDVPQARLKFMPKGLVDRARQQFPAAKQDDSVAAYIYFHEGMPSDIPVTDDIIAAAMAFTGENITVETVKDIVEKDLATVRAQNKVLAQKLDTLQLAMAYMIYAQAGFTKEMPVSPDAIKFLERGISDLIDKLESDADIKRQREANRKGRPIR